MKSIFLFLVVGLTTTAWGQVKADLSQLMFMSGNWKGAMAWGDMEEYWSAPMGDNMVCAYRCVNDGKVVFYEFIVIEQSQTGTPVMKLRHFSRGNIGWEDKDTPFEYPLIDLEASKATFESADKRTRLIYERVDSTHLRVVLEREKDGEWKVDEFPYTLDK